MKKLMVIVTSISAFVCSTAWAGQHFSLDVSKETLKGPSEHSSQSVLSGTYTIDANDYAQLHVSLGTSLSDDELRVQYDTYRDMAVTGNPIVSKEYRTSAEVKHRASVSASFAIPVSPGVDVFASAGYSATVISGSGFAPFVDNAPSSAPRSEWFSLTDCQITGIESRCGTVLQSEENELDLKGVFYTAGLVWHVSPSTALSVGYRHEGDSALSMKGPVFSVRFAL